MCPRASKAAVTTTRHACGVFSTGMRVQHAGVGPDSGVQIVYENLIPPSMDPLICFQRSIDRDVSMSCSRCL